MDQQNLKKKKEEKIILSDTLYSVCIYITMWQEKQHPLLYSVREF